MVTFDISLSGVFVCICSCGGWGDLQFCLPPFLFMSLCVWWWWWWFFSDPSLTIHVYVCEREIVVVAILMVFCCGDVVLMARRGGYILAQGQVQIRVNGLGSGGLGFGKMGMDLKCHICAT